ncbi:ATP-binding cassette domain-containing protein [Enterococcus mundtii]|uniref:Multidrug ABC transporter ATP-binding protein n=1 Tax=Enterococcus mundtii TaxID=53346 RepID=A0ABQ0VBX5_ENTMU|nr:ABC transporter ATP-binding protein [Enterococcus mundtii]GEN17618.1 multidrug ABC transporter ATP-binding protein [Ligilactobacillus acidipiscis]AUB51873.1 ATP-binding protein [Enterococcus mundtii]MDB7086424.1 ABC transporter ATP-binding protein [Enterococcus mundtii]MZZ58725.1 ATP-binding cassette domain-containing protein [Enterococcus mundtii]MZZ61559.1 ATP-binding cassette domain-containing protein [Enterococcus mundtii]
MIQLLRYAKDYRKQIILGPVFKFLEAVFELILPLLMASLIDNGLKMNNREVIINMGIWMIVMSVIGLICAIICQYYSSIASQGFGTELRNQLIKKINSFSHSELNHFGTDTLITRMTNDINQLQLALAMVIRLLIRAPFLSIGSVVMAFVIDWQVGLFFLALLPIFSIILYFIIRKTIPLYQKVQEKLDGLNETVSQNLSGVRVIRAFSRTNKEIETFDENTDVLAKNYLRVSNISALLSPATTLIMNVGIICLLTVGGVKVNIGSLQQGQVLALINYMNQMLLALIVVSNLVVIFTRAEASAQRVKEVLDTENTITDAETPSEPVMDSETILQFKDVDFRYTPESGLSLQGINFTLKRQTVLGIIGPTGSGKTTLTQLIPRFYDVSEGSVLFDEQDVRDWSLDTLRSQISQVPQTAVLFTGTIRENLQWGKPDATDAECWEALAIAQAEDFVRQLPKGLDTRVMENGKNFSGGQKQRLTIARALIAKPALLILDDSLSALDYQTDLNLRQALQTSLNTTVIIISQRIRSIQQAEHILVMDQGKIVAQGTHDTLLSQSSEYREIVASQEEE